VFGARARAASQHESGSQQGHRQAHGAIQVGGERDGKRTARAAVHATRVE
jgi:hypothetical protein